MQLHHVRLGIVFRLLCADSTSLVPHLYRANCGAPRICGVTVSAQTSSITDLAAPHRRCEQQSTYYVLWHNYFFGLIHNFTVASNCVYIRPPLGFFSQPSLTSIQTRHNGSVTKNITQPKPFLPPPASFKMQPQQPYYRTTKNGNLVPVVPQCPHIDCPFLPDGKTCGTRLTRASDIR